MECPGFFISPGFSTLTGFEGSINLSASSPSGAAGVGISIDGGATWGTIRAITLGQSFILRVTLPATYGTVTTVRMSPGLGSQVTWTINAMAGP